MIPPVRGLHSACHTWNVSQPVPTTAQRGLKWAIKHSLLIGIALALLCQFLPEGWREVCRDITHTCTGGLSK